MTTADIALLVGSLALVLALAALALFAWDYRASRDAGEDAVRRAFRDARKR